MASSGSYSRHPTLTLTPADISQHLPFAARTGKSKSNERWAQLASAGLQKRPHKNSDKSTRFWWTQKSESMAIAQLVFIYLLFLYFLFFLHFFLFFCRLRRCLCGCCCAFPFPATPVQRMRNGCVTVPHLIGKMAFNVQHLTFAPVTWCMNKCCHKPIEWHWHRRGFNVWHSFDILAVLCAACITHTPRRAAVAIAVSTIHISIMHATGRGDCDFADMSTVWHIIAMRVGVYTYNNISLWKVQGI